MIRNLIDRGLSMSEISRQLGIDRKTVRKYQDFTATKGKLKAGSLQRWHKGHE